MDSVLTLKDSQKYQDLLAKQFSEVAQASNISNEECWQLFLNQEPTQKVPQANLPTIKEVLNGNSSLLLKDWRNIIIENIKREKYCTLIPVLYSMAEGKLLPELVSHYLKITSIILSEEDMQNPFTVRYRDQKHQLREFCTYAKNDIDARLQALECIEYVASNPRSILDIVREQEHTDSFEW
jgi:hypothetical protein